MLVVIYVDKSSRLAATMKVYRYLQCGSDYQKEDIVRGTVWRASAGYGRFCGGGRPFFSADSGRELYGEIKVGDVVSARVSAVKEDGKLDLSLREKAYLQIGKMRTSSLR